MALARNWLVSAFAALSFAGPAHREFDREPTIYRLAISPQFTAAEAAQIVAATLDWRAAVPTLRFDFAAECERGVVCIAPGTPADLPGFASDWIGVEWRQEGRSRILLDTGEMARMMAENVVETVAAHELGHAMGLDHAAAGTIMAPAFWDCSQGGGMCHRIQAMKPTQADAAAWYSLR